MERETKKAEKKGRTFAAANEAYKDGENIFTERVCGRI